MPNPQLIAGGAVVSLPFTGTDTATAPYAIEILAPDSTVLVQSIDSGGSDSGWSWETIGGELRFELQAPADADAGVGYVIRSGDSHSALFDVVASSAATVESRRFFVPGNRGVWTDSGMVLGPSSNEGRQSEVPALQSTFLPVNNSYATPISTNTMRA